MCGSNQKLLFSVKMNGYRNHKKGGYFCTFGIGMMCDEFWSNNRCLHHSMALSNFFHFFWIKVLGTRDNGSILYNAFYLKVCFNFLIFIYFKLGKRALASKWRKCKLFSRFITLQCATKTIFGWNHYRAINFQLA